MAKQKKEQEYHLICFSVTGKGAKKFEKYVKRGSNKKTVVKESDFDEGQAEKLVASGYIEPIGKDTELEQMKAEFSELTEGKKIPASWNKSKLKEEIQKIKDRKASEDPPKD